MILFSFLRTLDRRHITLDPRLCILDPRPKPKLRYGSLANILYFNYESVFWSSVEGRGLHVEGEDNMSRVPKILKIIINN